MGHLESASHFLCNSYDLMLLRKIVGDNLIYLYRIQILIKVLITAVLAVEFHW